MSHADATPRTTDVRTPFNRLALLLGAGLVLAIILAFAGTGGPGLFTLEEAVFGLGFAALVIAVVLGALLLTVANILAELRSLRGETAMLREAIASDEKSHVLTIEGIGPKYASRLNASGIITVSQLLAADPAKIAGDIDVTPELVQEWQAMGRFMALPGIGPQYAEMLALAGLRTVDDLANASADALLARIDGIEAKRKTRVLKTDIQAGHVRKFIQAAKDSSGNVTIKKKA